MFHLFGLTIQVVFAELWVFVGILNHSICSIVCSFPFLCIPPLAFEKKKVFCYQNCSDLLREKIVLVIDKNLENSRLKAKNLQIFQNQ